MQGRFWIVLPILMILLAGCSGGSGSIHANPLTPPIALSISPATASVGVGGNQTFTAAVTNTPKTGVTWSVLEGNAGGVIDAAGIYTAPSTIGTFHVVATSQADATKTASVPVAVHTLVAIAPAAATIVAGSSRLFTAAVTGSANTGVTWGIQEGAAGGAIDANGNYTAPNTSGTYHVTATSQADGTQANATVNVQAGTAPGGNATGTIQ